MLSRAWIYRILVLTLIVATTGIAGVYAYKTVAEDAKPQARVPLTEEQKKLKAEYDTDKKQRYLETLQRNKGHYLAMAAEMDKVYAACSGDDYESCKKARKAAALELKRFEEERKEAFRAQRARSQAFKQKLGEMAGQQQPDAAEEDTAGE